MTLSPVAIATAIAGLSPIDTDIMVKDLGNFLDAVTSRDTPVLMPFAPQFISDVKFVPRSMGEGLTRKSDFTYMMNWRFYYRRTGTSRKLSDVYDGLVDKTMNIVETIIANDSLSAEPAAVNINLELIGTFGVVDDSAGNTCYGCDLKFEILEFMT